MMRVYLATVGRYAGVCGKHPLDTTVEIDAHRMIELAHRHNMAMHPRRARRDLRKLIS
ncbi:MAG TPA: hypothetical protein VGL98_03605 [Gammaproteobacteria bacterium]